MAAMKKGGKPRLLHRYTSAASAMNVLSTNSLTLLSPASWEDRNDREYMDAFKRYAKAETLLALCLTAASETHHHWSVFAPGTDGVRIVLDEEKLKQVTGDGSGVTMRDVEYRTIEKMGKHPLLPSDLPFIKRYPYRGEEEVRLLFHSSECFRFHSIKLLEGTIREVALSPRLPEAFSDDMKAAIQAAAEKSDAGTPRVYRSTLLENNDWIKFAKKFEVPDN